MKYQILTTVLAIVICTSLLAGCGRAAVVGAGVLVRPGTTQAAIPTIVPTAMPATTHTPTPEERQASLLLLNTYILSTLCDVIRQNIGDTIGQMAEIDKQIKKIQQHTVIRNQAKIAELEKKIDERKEELSSSFRYMMDAWFGKAWELELELKICRKIQEEKQPVLDILEERLRDQKKEYGRVQEEYRRLRRLESTLCTQIGTELVPLLADLAPQQVIQSILNTMQEQGIGEESSYRAYLYMILFRQQDAMEEAAEKQPITPTVSPIPGVAPTPLQTTESPREEPAVSNPTKPEKPPVVLSTEPTPVQSAEPAPVHPTEPAPSPTAVPTPSPTAVPTPPAITPGSTPTIVPSSSPICI